MSHIGGVTTPPVTQAAELAAIRRAIGARYSLERELGRGGMGTVYLARDLKLDRPVALKVLPAEFAAQVSLRDRFLRETRTAASFSHPNIVPVYAVEESEDLLAYAMGFIEGETLAERVARTGPMPVRDVVRMLQDTGYALAYAHGRGVVHRDIKPDNIMLERATGRALVMDFGISRSMAHALPSANLTRVGEVVGTPEYMSPEQAAGDVVDGRSDLYSLGLTAHFAATGRTVMAGESTQKILVKQLTEAVPSIAATRSDFPAALAAAIDQCVQKDPADRFATAEALVDAIDAAQLSEPDIPVPIRLFAGEVSTLSMVAIGILLYSWLFARSSQMSSLDTLLPIVGLLAVLFTRSLTTLGEARRLAIAGFSVDEVIDGFGRVMHERAQRRQELRADPDTRAARRLAIRLGIVGLIVSIALEVSGRLIDIECRHPRYLRGNERVQHLAEQGGVRLAPEAPRPAKAIRLVAVVVRRWEMLPAFGNGRVRNAIPVLDARGAESRVVPRVGLLHAGMVRHAKPHRVRFLEHGLHDVAVDAQDLDAVHAHRLELANARPCGGGCLRNGCVGEPAVDEQSRGRQLAARTAVAYRDHFLRCIRAHLAHRRDAAGQPELERVVKRLRDVCALVLQVRVRVDQSRQHELSRRINLAVRRRPLRIRRSQCDGIEEGDARDPVADDEDVRGSGCRSAVAVDDGGVADREARPADAVRWEGLRTGLACEEDGCGAGEQGDPHVSCFVDFVDEQRRCTALFVG